MKAIIYDRPGEASVLRLVDREIPEPGAGEVRIKVIVSGVNPTDWKTRSGVLGGEPDPIERVPNQDGAGIVDAVGPGVDGVAVGDRCHERDFIDFRRASAFPFRARAANQNRD